MFPTSTDISLYTYLYVLMSLYLEERFLEMDSWVKEYASSILNYITVVNDYIAVSLILICLGLMTSAITPMSLITGIPFFTF